MSTVYEAAGGDAGLLALARAWHERCLSDPVASHPFEHGDLHPQHVERLAAYWAEALVELAVRPVAGMHPQHVGLVVHRVGEGARPAERLGPVGGEALAVLGVETVAEGVADHVVCHHPGVPRPGKSQQALLAPGGLVHALHVPKDGSES